MIIPMQPPSAATLNAALAPFWELLRVWVRNAVAEHRHVRDHLTRDELVPLRRSIALIEAMLRRLVLVAATAIALDIAARSATARQTPARPRTHKARRTRRAKKTFRVHTSARANAGRRNTRSASTSHDRAHYSKDDPDLSPDEYDAWYAAQPRATAEERAAELKREMDEVTAQQEQASKPRRKPSTGEARPKLERKTVPEQVSTQAEQERLAFLEQLVANPAELIRRTALAIARSHELALRLAQAEPPKPRGILIAAPEFYGVIIPVAAVCKKALTQFALRHPELDTC